MIYIEKENKKSLKGILNNVQEENSFEKEKIVVPYDINKYLSRGKEKKIRTIARKVVKIVDINGYENILVSDELKENEMFLNALYGSNINIIDGKIIYQMLIRKIVEYACKKNNIELKTVNLSILINRPNKYMEENILELSKKVRRLNIITSNRQKFSKLEERVSNHGVIINISANRKKTLLKSDLIINYDFSQELINKCSIKDEAVIINILYDTIILKKRYNGININNFEVIEKKNVVNSNICDGYSLKEIYESLIIEKRINTKYALDNLEIKNLEINNGII